MVLGGPNGSGKTSLLEAALLGMNADSVLPRRASYGPSAIRKGSRGYRIVAEFDVDGRPFVVQRGASGSAPKLPRPRVAYFSSWRAQREVGELPVTARGGRAVRPISRENGTDSGTSSSSWSTPRPMAFSARGRMYHRRGAGTVMTK